LATFLCNYSLIENLGFGPGPPDFMDPFAVLRTEDFSSEVPVIELPLDSFCLGLATPIPWVRPAWEFAILGLCAFAPFAPLFTLFTAPLTIEIIFFWMVPKFSGFWSAATFPLTNLPRQSLFTLYPSRPWPCLCIFAAANSKPFRLSVSLPWILLPLLCLHL
jgi:hypothetical protein